MTENDRIQEQMVDGFLPSIGIECHVQLKTRTKLFAPVAAAGKEAPANSSVSPLCLGLPGALPVVNEMAIELAILAGLALEAEIASETAFDRKHYFYPDLPLGYQISQQWQPIITGGRLTIPISDDQSFEVGIQRAHLEADAGKLTHRPDADYSLVDLNRVGTPLLEIVSLPEMHTRTQAKRYAKELYLRMIYAGVCDGDLSAGNLRFDVNISVSSEPSKLGTRTEIKNLNSFRFIEQALDYEIKRQIEILKGGGKIAQETRGWNESARKTFSQRSKEDAQDYRYMPDPDIPPLTISTEQIASLKERLGVMPQEIRARLKKWQIPFKTAETLLDYPEVGGLLPGLSDSLTAAEAKIFCNWLVGDVLALVKVGEIDWEIITASAARLATLARMVGQGEISSAKAKEWLPQILKEKADPTELASVAGVSRITDPQTLRTLVEEVFARNPGAVADARQDAKAAGFLIGQVMSSSSGNADPRLVAQIVGELLRE